jgi:hypothetical protein
MSGIAIAHRWLKAFNDHLIDDLLELYDDNAEHYSPRLLKMHPETNGLIKGKAAMFQWWQNAFERMPTLTYSLIQLKEEEDKIRSVEGEPDSTVNEMIQIRDGKIVFSKVLEIDDSQ